MGEIEAVFTYWQEVMGKARSRMDIHRRKAISGRLAEGYTVADLCDAINGCAASKFHMGQNDRQNRYNDICLICRDAAHVDQFIERWETVERMAARKGEDDNTPKPSTMTPEERQAAHQRMQGLIRRVA